MVDALIIDDALAFVRALLEQDDVAAAAAYLRTLHPGEAAEVLARLDDEAQQRLIRHLDDAWLADLLEHMDEDEQADVIEHIRAERLANVLDDVEPDVAADVLGELPPEQAGVVLAHMESADEVAPLLEFPPDTAGGLMNRPGPMLRRHMTVAEAFEFLRTHYRDERELLYLYVLDRHGKLVGVVSLRALILADPHQTIGEIMNPNVITVRADADQEEVADLFTRYGFLALPVVDEEDHLLGVITVEDILDVVQDEATEDIYRLAGMDEDAELFSPIREAARTRLFWLMVNLLTAFLASAVVSLFESTIARVAVLATFMPIIAGQGGNAGIQTSTIVIRSLALGRLELDEVWKALRYEVMLGFINGVVIGLVVAVVAVLWKGNPMLGVVIGVAMVGNMLVAALAGVLIPFTLQRLGRDPALASGIFLTTATDVCGFFFFLGLGTLLLL